MRTTNQNYQSKNSSKLIDQLINHHNHYVSIDHHEKISISINENIVGIQHGSDCVLRQHPIDNLDLDEILTIANLVSDINESKNLPILISRVPVPNRFLNSYNFDGSNKFMFNECQGSNCIHLFNHRDVKVLALKDGFVSFQTPGVGRVFVDADTITYAFLDGRVQMISRRCMTAEQINSLGLDMALIEEVMQQINTRPNKLRSDMYAFAKGLIEVVDGGDGSGSASGSGAGAGASSSSRAGSGNVGPVEIYDVDDDYLLNEPH